MQYYFILCCLKDSETVFHQASLNEAKKTYIERTYQRSNKIFKQNLVYTLNIKVEPVSLRNSQNFTSLKRAKREAISKTFDCITLKAISVAKFPAS